LRRIYFIRAYLPRVLGASPPLAILTAYVSATAETPLPKPHAAACVILAGILFVLFWMRRRLLQWASSTFSSNALSAPATPLSDEDFFSFRSFLGENRITAYLTGLAVAFIAAYAVAAVLSPIGTGLGLGPVPVLLLSLSIIVAIWGIAVVFSAHSNFPYATIVVLVLLVTHNADKSQTFDLETNPTTRPSPRTAWASFGTAAENPAVFVATAGGGSRAAYWTAAILGDLHDRTQGRFSDRLFAVSGVSGGSIGAMFYRATLEAVLDRSKTPIAQPLRRMTREDFLSPVFAAWFTRDAIPFNVFPDRARIIERTWARAFAKHCKTFEDKADCGIANVPLQSISGRPGRLPALLLNGTVVESGARAVASTLRLDCRVRGEKPAAGCDGYTTDWRSQFTDAIDLSAIETGDVRRFSAGSVSARFPIVLPAERFGLSGKNGERVDRHIADGGYFENFGAITLLQLMKDVGLRREVAATASDRGTPATVPQPVNVIQISSDPDINAEDVDLSGRGSTRGDASPAMEIGKIRKAALNLRSASGRQAIDALRRHTEEELRAL
jgi:hypothetical protein